MPNETIYTHAYFPMPEDEELYIIGFLPIIDNRHLTHHLIAYLCIDEVAAYTTARPGEAVEPQSAELNGAAHSCAQHSLSGCTSCSVLSGNGTVAAVAV